MATRGQGRSKNDVETLWLSDTAMAHLFRGELGRSDRWRTRLDTTTNWALTTTAAVISFAFANADVAHVVLLVGIWMVVTFLLIEARRYRYYDLWNRRVRLMEDGYWAPLLRHEPVDPDAMRELAVELSRPQIQLSLFSAISTRINRAYGPILLVLFLVWFVKVYSHPRAPESVTDFMHRAQVGPVSGWVVSFVVAVLFAVVAFAFGSSFFARQPLGELRTRPRPRRAVFETLYRPYLRQRGGRRAQKKGRSRAPIAGVPAQSPPGVD